MKDDIRVIKQVGTISSGEGSWQKDLNIVSVNNGSFIYDLREWSLDHSAYKDGISFDNEEAKVLLAVLKECFKDGDGISINQFPEAYTADNKIGQMKLVVEQPKPEQDDASLYNLLKEKGISYTDKRDKGGALWVVGSHELDNVMIACGELGYKFYFSEKGGRITQGQPGWYLPSKKG